MLSFFLSTLLASQNIVIVGAKRISRETICSYVSKENDTNMMLKKLYATGYFENIAIQKDKDKLIITVQEREIIGNIFFEGNKAIKEEVLRKEIKLKTGAPLSRPQVQEIVGQLMNTYHRMGKCDVSIHPKFITRQSASVDLIFEINEGETKNIQKIIFFGNKAFSTSELEDVLLSKRSKWYRFFASDDTFDEERFLQDQYLLKKFYMNKGFLDIHIQQAFSEYNPAQNGFTLIFKIKEGKQYSIKDIKILSLIKTINPKALLNCITFDKNDIFNAQEIENTCTQIEEKLLNQGYQFIAIEPKIDHKEDQAVVTFVIQESPKSYVQRIKIQGNHHTHDRVIRREILLHEGDPYNHSKIKKTEDALSELGFFKNVKIDAHPENYLTNIVVEAQEQPTGEIMLGGGYSTLDGPIGMTRLIEKNFRGTGNILSAEFSIAKKRQDFDIGLTDPRFFGKKIVASTNIFVTRSTRFDMFSYTTKGFNAGLSYHLSDHWIQGWTYGFSSEHIKEHKDDFSTLKALERRLLGMNLDPKDSPLNDRGRYNVSSLAHKLTYDRRNSALKPTQGFVSSLTTTYTGLGGSIKSLRHEASTALYCPIAENTTLILNPKAGMMHKIRRSLRTVDRFNLGMGTFRGFDFGGLGPRYTLKSGKQSFDTYVGGTRYFVFSTDLEFPVGLPNEFGMKGILFSDYGKVWRSDLKNPYIVDRNSMRLSLGVGLKWNSPFGPLKFEYGFAVKKAKGDDQRRFIFGYTTPM